MIEALLLAAAAATEQAWVSNDAADVGRLFDQPVTTCRSDDVTVVGGRLVRVKFYDGMTGFARTAGTTGGLGRSVFRVMRTDDPAGPSLPGTLRWAVAKATAACGGWVACAPELRGRAIRLTKPLRLASNITIDGGCAMPRLIGTGRGSVFYLHGSRNVVLARLRVEQSGGGGDGDCVTVSHGADQVWLTLLQLRRCRDGLVDVTRDRVAGPMRVTVSNSRFSEHDKAMLVVGTPLSAPCNLSSLPIQLTVARNVFHHTGQRHPRASGDAFVDLHDNVIAFSSSLRATGGMGGAYGTLAVGGAHIVVRRTLYAPAAGRQFRIAATETRQTEGNSTACRQGRIEWQSGAKADGQERLDFVRSVIRATEAGQDRPLE